MLRDITLGQYYPADSVIHKLDPRVKLFGTLIYIISLFVFKGLPAFILAAIFLVVLIKLSKVPFSYMVKGLKTIVPVSYTHLDVYKRQDTQLATLKTGAASLDAGLNGDDGIVAGVNTLDSSVNGALSQGITDLTNGAKQLADGANTLVANNDKLNAGMTSLKSATDLLINGVDQLEDGSETLADGMAQFDEQAIEKLADAYNGDLKELLDKVDAVLDAGNEYNTFTRTADGVKGNVKFIWETASIKAED